MSAQLLSSKHKRAERLRATRELAKLSRQAVERKYGLSQNTLKNWEYAVHAGLTEHGARVMVDIFQRENLNCTVSWLLHGTGKSPHQHQVELKTPRSIEETPDQAYQTIQDEVNDFKKRHPEGIVYQVKDDTMLPVYRLGDFVAGVRHYTKDIAKLIGKDCIIETKKGDITLGVLAPSTILHYYNIYALNPQTRIEKPYWYDVEITAAAPIVWIRRNKKW